MAGDLNVKNQRIQLMKAAIYIGDRDTYQLSLRIHKQFKIIKFNYIKKKKRKGTIHKVKKKIYFQYTQRAIITNL